MPARSRLYRSPVALGAAVVVAAAAIGGVAYAGTGGSPGYRTATVTAGAVTATLDLVGTAAPVHAATVGFAQSGTVATVGVKVGDQVTAGQQLAQLDLTSLRQKLTQAQATQAAAQLTLQQAQDGQLIAVTGGSGARTGSAGTGTTATTGGTTPTTAPTTTAAGGSGRTGSAGGTGATSPAVDTTALRAAQQGVLGAQKAVDAGLATARTDLAAATAACAAAANPPTPTPTPSASPTDGAPATPASPTSPAPAQQCLSAETTLLAVQTGLGAKQTALSAALATLSQELDTASAAVTAAAAAATHTTSTTTPPTTATGAATTSAARSTTSAVGSGTGTTSGTVGAAQLAAYQAALDADTAATAVAQQNLAQGTAVSPLSGTVVSVGLKPGASVTAASATAVIGISAPDGYQLTTTVPTASIQRIAIGEPASVVPDGGATPLSATVTSIAANPGTSGYQVLLGVTGPSTGLHQGSSAAVHLTTGSQSDVMLVPTSAVHTLGTRHVVEVLTGGAVKNTVVTLGTMGPAQTQVLSGLTVGEKVVLADLSSTATSDSSTSTTTGGRSGLTGGGFGGAGGFGGTGGFGGGTRGGAGAAGRAGG
ncbi:MAG: hypothetical protein JWM48_1396 [Mycobacterium sp.]|nr:hypothetical protein [Mycobacterium sp.]